MEAVTVDVVVDEVILAYGPAAGVDVTADEFENGAVPFLPTNPVPGAAG